MKINLNIWKHALTLSIVLQALCTQRHYVLFVDGPDVLMWGFPLAFLAEGLHTSNSLQFFILEFLVDFTFYIVLSIVLLKLINRFFPTVKLNGKIVLISAFMVVVGFVLVLSISNTMFKLKRDAEVKHLTNEIEFIWQSKPRPDLEKYR